MILRSERVPDFSELITPQEALDRLRYAHHVGYFPEDVNPYAEIEIFESAADDLLAAKGQYADPGATCLWSEDDYGFGDGV